MGLRIDFFIGFQDLSQNKLHCVFVVLLLVAAKIGCTSNVLDLTSDHCTKHNNMCSRFRADTVIVGDSILTLPEEETTGKRVYVIGDVHGCYDELISLLQQCDALKTEDAKDGLKDDVLVVFVGDLVNKGPNSHAVIQFAMSTKGVYSVRGNHEVYWIGASHRKGSKEEMDYLKSLPYVISIPEYNALIVHAGFMPRVLIPDQRIEDIVNMRNVITRAGGEQVGYPETDIGVHWAGLWKGPEHVYYGHDARRGQDEQGRPRVQRFPWATGLDTRCVKGGTLTAVQLPVDKEVFHSVKSKEMYSVR